MRQTTSNLFHHNYTPPSMIYPLRNNLHPQRIRHSAVFIALQNRVASITALFMTVFLLCLEHVRAFAHQYHVTSHEALILASAASSLSRNLSKTYLGLSGEKIMKKSISFFGSSSSLSTAPVTSHSGSSTKLSMTWSIPVPPMPSILTRKDVPVHTLWSWYSEVDFTTNLPVYDDEYENSYSFRSPTDDWPSISSSVTELKQQPYSQQKQPSAVRRSPFMMIFRRVTSGFGRVMRFPHNSPS